GSAPWRSGRPTTSAPPGPTLRGAQGRVAESRQRRPERRRRGGGCACGRGSAATKRPVPCRDRPARRASPWPALLGVPAADRHRLIELTDLASTPNDAASGRVASDESIAATWD